MTLLMFGYNISSMVGDFISSFFCATFWIARAGYLTAIEILKC